MGTGVSCSSPQDGCRPCFANEPHSLDWLQVVGLAGTKMWPWDEGADGRCPLHAGLWGAPQATRWLVLT